jgi:uncharacterized membrane protein
MTTDEHLRGSTRSSTLNLRSSILKLATRQLGRWLALVLFLLYLAVFPGSTITIALDRVPAWGEWMGGVLLLLQGAIVLCWLVGSYGRRGALAAALVFLLAWGVEHIGVSTGFPFGRYRYTTLLQPQLLGDVPLVIPCAWLMVAVGSWQLAAQNREPPRGYPTENHPEGTRPRIAEQRTKLALERSEGNKEQRTSHATRNTLLAATLVVLLDMQIEPVATAISRYWVWLDDGIYYGVPAANFVAWWVVGLVMAAIVGRLLDNKNREPRTENGHPPGQPRTRTKNKACPERSRREQRIKTTHHVLRFTFYVLRFMFHVLPASLYLLNTLMFAAINLGRGYLAAGVVGLAVLFAVGLAAFQAPRTR